MNTYIIHTNDGKTFKIQGTVLDVSSIDELLTIRCDHQLVGFFSVENIAFIADAKFVKTSK